MKVILTKDVDTLGEGGELVDVSEGYARNYLFPRKMAVVATEGAVKDRNMRLQRIKAKAEKKHQEDLNRAALVEKIGKLTLTARAGEHGKLFGAVTTKELARLVSEKTRIDVDRKSIQLNHPINRLGEYEMTIRFSPKVSAKLAVVVISEESEGDFESELAEL